MEGPVTVNIGFLAGLEPLLTTAVTAGVVTVATAAGEADTRAALAAAMTAALSFIRSLIPGVNVILGF